MISHIPGIWNLIENPYKIIKNGKQIYIGLYNSRVIVKKVKSQQLIVHLGRCHTSCWLK